MGPNERVQAPRSSSIFGAVIISSYFRTRGTRIKACCKKSDDPNPLMKQPSLHLSPTLWRSLINYLSPRLQRLASMNRPLPGLVRPPERYDDKLSEFCPPSQRCWYPSGASEISGMHATLERVGSLVKLPLGCGYFGFLLRRWIRAPADGWLSSSWSSRLLGGALFRVAYDGGRGPAWWELERPWLFLLIFVEVEKLVWCAELTTNNPLSTAEEYEISNFQLHKFWN